MEDSTLGTCSALSKSKARCLHFGETLLLIEIFSVRQGSIEDFVEAPKVLKSELVPCVFPFIALSSLGDVRGGF